MALFIKGDDITAGANYTLYKKVNNEYSEIAEENQINFNVNQLLEDGAYKLSVIARKQGSEDSDHSNELSCLVEAIKMDHDEKISGYYNKNTGVFNATTNYNDYLHAYKNIDANAAYYASGFAPKSTGNAAAIIFLDETGSFLGFEDGNTLGGLSSQAFLNKRIVAPANTAEIRIQSNSSQTTPPALRKITAVNNDDYEQLYPSVEVSGYLLKADGTIKTSSVDQTYTFKNINPQDTLYASGFCPSATGQASPICYYDESGAFIRSQAGFLNSETYTRISLNVPNNARVIKMGKYQNVPCVLYKYVGTDV